MSEKGGKGKQEQVVGGREEERKREEEGEGERFLANYCFKESIDSHQGGGFKLLILVSLLFLGTIPAIVLTPRRNLAVIIGK